MCIILRVYYFNPPILDFFQMYLFIVRLFFSVIIYYLAVIFALFLLCTLRIDIWDKLTHKLQP